MLKFEEVMNYVTNGDETRQLSLAQRTWNNHFPSPRKEEEIHLESLGETGTGAQAGDREGGKYK